MFHRAMFSLVAATAFVSLAPAMVAAPPAETSSTLRRADGQPDIEGTYTFRTLTRLERPAVLEGKEALDPETAKAFEASENKRLNRDLFDPIKGAPSAGYAPRSEGGVLSYNEFWYERGIELTKDKRTSLIVDPPDGRIPWSEEGAERRRQRRELRRLHGTDSHENRSLADRCIMGFNSGPPMTSGAYNNNVQIFQTAGTVAILNEMVHNARVIPLDDRPHLTSAIRTALGDARGHWEGDTLVVETTNLKAGGRNGSSSNLRLVERFTRVDRDTLQYEYTMHDPTTWTQPWTARIFMRPAPGTGVIYEFACHEGNYALEHTLRGARLQEGR